MMASEERWMTAEQVAIRLGLPKPYIYRIMKDKELPAIKIGRYWRVCEADLDRWTESKRYRPNGKPGDELVPDEEEPNQVAGAEEVTPARRWAPDEQSSESKDQVVECECSPERWCDEHSPPVRHPRPAYGPAPPRERYDLVMSRWDAAHELGLTVEKVSALIKNGELPAWRPGDAGAWIISKEGVREWKEKNRG